jgi:ankyrin repeat protein
MKRKYETELEMPSDIKNCSKIASALEEGLDPNFVVGNDTLFEWAMNEHAIDTAKLLMDQSGFDPRKQGRFWTPLSSAVLAREFGIAEKLIRRGADVFAQNSAERNILHTLCCVPVVPETPDLLPFLNLLLRRGGGWNLYSRDLFGRTLFGCIAPDSEIARLLRDMDRQHREICRESLSEVIGVGVLVNVVTDYLF